MFLQQRVALFAKVFGTLTLAFCVLGQVTGARRQLVLGGRHGDVIGFMQILAACGFAAIWLRTRRGQRSERELRALESTASVLPTLVVTSLLALAPLPLRPELLGTIAIAHVLMARAVIVPSTPRRTALVGLAVAVPFICGTYAFYVHHQSPALPPPWFFTLVAGCWCSASIGLSTIASYTIFGLRQKVREATELGQYTLEEKIGEGGMGIVYRARHAMLRRPTAIKLLPPERAGEQNLARFEREVQLTSALTHPNTIAIYDYGRTPDGVFYYAMEFLDGLDLEALVERDGPQAPGCVVHLLEQIAGALAEAHAAGLIHRDIKPANVLLCERGGVHGVAMVVDFGLVKNVHAAGDPALSTVDAVMGTPLYLAPEAIARPASVDARSDLYALGALGYFLLTGCHVFDGDTVVEVCAQHLHSVPLPPSERLGASLPAELEALILRCLAKHPEQRPQSAAGIAAELRSLTCRDAWTADVAAVWWTRVRAAAPSRRPHAEAVSRTLAVEWAGR